MKKNTDNGEKTGGFKTPNGNPLPTVMEVYGCEEGIRGGIGPTWGEGGRTRLKTLQKSFFVYYR